MYNKKYLERMLHIINETINTYFIYSSFSFAYFIKKISIKNPISTLPMTLNAIKIRVCRWQHLTAIYKTFNKKYFSKIIYILKQINY